MTLDRNPANFFAETEQVAFHPGHLVPGIGFVDDPLLHARLFSYLDTQLTRLGGPNFAQIPINRPRAEVNDNNRDGFSQQVVHEGVASYSPNSLGGGCPFAHPGGGAYTHPPLEVRGPKVKLRPSSFDDHFTQATLFYRSLSEVEQEHVASAFSFELGKCIAPEVRERMVANLAHVDADLATTVAAHLGLDAPLGEPVEPQLTSPALRIERGEPGPVAGRMVAVLVGDDTSGRTVSTWRGAADPLGVEIVTVGPRFGKLGGGVTVDRTIHITDPVEYDGVVVATDPDEASAAFVQEAFRHHKTVGLVGRVQVAGVEPGGDGVAADPSGFFEALAMHRHWGR
jgi:catalase